MVCGQGDCCWTVFIIKILMFSSEPKVLMTETKLEAQKPVNVTSLC